ncbi:MAG TPA: LysE family translocator, partial [Pseudonocardiaceae bacterium]
GAEWLVFLGSTAVFAMLPGPGILYVLARALRGGRSEGFRSATGTALGAMVHVTAASFGLSAVLATSAQAFTVIKFIGGGYLILLGLRTLFGRSKGEAPVRPGGRRGPIVQGVLTEVFNPKTALFFLAFLPHFVHPERGGGPLVFILLGLVVVAMALVVDLAVAAGAGTLGAKLAARPHWMSRQKAVSGVAMVGAGTALLLAERD